MPWFQPPLHAARSVERQAVAARVRERSMSPALLLGGLGALSWGAGALLSARSSRALGALPSVLWLGIAGVPFGVVLALAGHRLPAAAYVGLTLMVAGLLVLSGSGGSTGAERSGRVLSRTATNWIAVVTACCYGGMLYCAGGVHGTSPLWTVTIARAVATGGAR